MKNKINSFFNKIKNKFKGSMDSLNKNSIDLRKNDDFILLDNESINIPNDANRTTGEYVEWVNNNKSK